MSLLKWLFETFASHTQPSAPQDQQPMNPATGLPMVGSVDTAGNVYGTQSHDHVLPSSSHDWPSTWSHDWPSSSSSAESFGSSSSSWTPSQDFSRPPSSGTGDW